MGDFRHVALALWDGMAHLKQSLKTGKPLSRMDTGGELQVWEKLVIGIIPIAEPVAKALCDILRIGGDRKGLRVLDITGGSSIFGMTILAQRSIRAGHAAGLAQRQCCGKETQPRARL